MKCWVPSHRALRGLRIGAFVAVTVAHWCTGPSVFCIVECFKRTWPFGFLVCSLPTTNCRVGSDREAS